MAGNRTLKVTITGDAAGLKKATKESEAALQSFSAGYRGASKSAADWGEDIRKASGVAAAAALYLAKKAGDAAVDTSESLNKGGVVFGAYADQVVAFADESAKAYGISKRAALEYTGTLGNLLVSSGIAKDTAADFSVTMTQLAADLASFNNTSVDDAFEAIRSGLVGESEPLKRFGVNLNEATLKAKALELGLYSGKGALDANAKAQAAYAVIMSQTTTAANDFAETSDGVANQQKIIAATADDAAASLGKELQPAYKALVSVVGSAVDALDGVPGPLKATGLGIVAVGGGAAYMVPKVMNAASAVKDMSDSLQASVAASGRASIGLKALGGASITAAIAGMVILADRLADNRRKADEWASSITSGKGPVDALRTLANATKEASAAAGEGSINGFDPDDSALFVTWSTAARKAADQADATNKAWKEASAQLLLVGSAADIAAAALEGTIKGQKWMAIAAAQTRAAADEQRAYAASVEGAKDAVAAGTATTQQAHQVNRDRLNQVTEQISKNEELRSSLRTLADSVKAYNDNEREARGFGTEVAAIRANAAKQAVADSEAIRQAQRVEVDAARGLEQANRGVEQAVRARAEAARAVVQAERGVVDAERGVQDALRGVTDAHRAVRDAEWGRQDALRGLQTAIRGIEQAEYARGQALRSVEAAERAVVRSEEDSLRSVQNLAQARREAAWELTSQALAARGDALSIQSAQLALADAQAAAAKGPSADNEDPRAAQRLSLAVSQAQLQLDQANASAARSTVELSEAQAAGVEGSDAVISALRGVEDGSLSVEDANRALIEANRGVTDADRAVTDAHLGVRDALRGVESAGIAADEANRGVADANRAVGESMIGLDDAHRAVADALIGVRDADVAVKDATYAVRDAQVAVADAAKATATAVQTAADNQQIAIFETNLVMDAAKKKSGELRDKVISDMGQAADAMRPFNYSLATTQALLAGILGTTPIAAAPQVAAILAGLSGVAIPGVGFGEQNVNGGGGVVRRAVGGSVTKGQPVLVGERRPELFVPNESGRIEPRVAGGDGQAMYADVTLNLDGMVVARQVVPLIPKVNRAMAGSRR